MKKLIIFAIAVALSGCGGSGGGTSPEEPEKTYTTFSNGSGVFFIHNDKRVLVTEKTAVLSSGEKADIVISDHSSPGVLVYIFDDGYISHYEKVAPAFENLGVRAGFAVYVSRIGRPGGMSRDQLLDLQARGFEIVNHSATHKNLSGYTEPVSVAEDEIAGAKRSLESMGLIINTFVAPYSTTNTAYMDIVRDNHKTAYTIYKNSPGQDSLWSDEALTSLHRLNTEQSISDIKESIKLAANQGGFLTLYDHDIDGGKTTLSKVEEIVSYAATLGMDIETPLYAARLRSITSRSECEFDISTERGNVDIGCRVSSSLKHSSKMSGEDYLPLPDGVYGHIKVDSGKASSDAPGCSGNGAINARENNTYSVKLNDECTAYFARSGGSVYSLFTTSERMYTQISTF